MNWEAAGAVGEILGAIAVVATLLYLAKQTRINTEAVKVNNLRIRTDRDIAHSRSALATPGLLAAYQRAQQDPMEVTREEYAMFGTYLHTIALDLQEYYQLYIKPGIPDQYRERDNFERSMLYQFGRPGGRYWWTKSRVDGDFEDDFVAYMNGLLAQDAPNEV